MKKLKEWWLFNLMVLATVITFCIKFTGLVELTYLQALIPVFIWMVLVVLFVVLTFIVLIKHKKNGSI